MVNCNRHWPLKVKLFPDSDYSPFRSTAFYDRADNGDEQRASAIADGLLSARITVKSVHNLLSLTSLHGSPFPFLPPLCELYSSLIPTHISSAPLPLLSSTENQFSYLAAFRNEQLSQAWIESAIDSSNFVWVCLFRYWIWLECGRRSRRGARLRARSTLRGTRKNGVIGDIGWQSIIRSPDWPARRRRY